MLVTTIPGLTVQQFESFTDERGTFQRIFDAPSLVSSGHNGQVIQASFSRNKHAHTLRGLHFMTGHTGETKTVACVRGSIADVVVDMRRESSTYLDHVMLFLDGDRGQTVTLPPGCAHGYLTMTTCTEILYFMSAPYSSDQERGLRFDDACLGIDWPAPPAVVSNKDLSWPPLREAQF